MKTLGLLLSFLGPLFLGLISARGESLRLQRERGMLKLMLHGEEKIRHSLCPRDELFFDFENAALSRCGFLPALKAGARAREEPLGILERHRRALDLDERVFSSCQRYFSRLGKLDYDSQLHTCSFYRLPSILQ